MIEVSYSVLWAVLSAAYLLGVLVVELDLRRNLKKNSSVVPMVFGKNVIIKDQE